MQQVYLYYKGSANTPANRDITELFLMEEFHWTPKQIAEIPYKNIQKIILIRNQRYEAQRINENISRAKNVTSSIGGKGSYTREI